MIRVAFSFACMDVGKGREQDAEALLLTKKSLAIKAKHQIKKHNYP